MPTTSAIAGVRAGFSWDTQKTTNVGVNSTNSGGFSYSKSFPTGGNTPAVGTVTKFYVDQFELDIAGSGSGASKTIDLVSTTLLDPFGDAISFTKIRYIYIELVLDDTNVSDAISVDLTGTNVFGLNTSAVTSGSTAVMTIQKGGCFQLSVGNGPGIDTADSGTTPGGDKIIIKNTDSVTAHKATVRICVAGI